MPAISMIRARTLRTAAIRFAPPNDKRNNHKIEDFKCMKIKTKRKDARHKDGKTPAATVEIGEYNV